MPLPAHPIYPPTLGARLLEDGSCQFRVWASKARRIDLRLMTPDERLLPMTPAEPGYFELRLEGIAPGTQYLYRIDGEHDRPDPASRHQPHGVHRPSAVVSPDFPWTDHQWSGLPLHRYITYELHVGTFTLEGTFDAVVSHLDNLKDLGITAIELMPVAQFPGGRNWGYDGVHPFAPQNTYGGPDGLRRLVDACHARELAVVLDVVYNHLGPEGNYLGQFAHYFTGRYRTPWGEAINVDDRHSDEVRRFFIENALAWIEEYHVDALRLDAVHAICDFRARPFLQELAESVRLQGERLNRRVYTIAESSLNDPRLIRPVELGGAGIDGQWNDDLHHALRTAITGDCGGYYADFRGVRDLCKAYEDGFVMDGQSSAYRGRRHGKSARDVPPEKLVVFAQNHDHIGNRMLGERLGMLVSFERLKLAAAAVLLSPYQPLLFMGEEYAETAPFQYFVSHTDPGLIEGVRKGRREEFAQFAWEGEPPDPQAEETFTRCRLNHRLKESGFHQVMWNFYRELISLRTGSPALAFANRERMDVKLIHDGHAVLMLRRATGHDVAVVLNFDEKHGLLTIPLPSGTWTKQLDSADPYWNGPGSPVPGRIETAGEVTIPMAGLSVLVLFRVTGKEA